MRRLAVWTLILFVITSALTVGAIAYGRSRPDNNLLRLAGFEVCDGKPCFRGMWSGMPWQQVETLQGQQQSEDYPSFFNFYFKNALIGVFADKNAVNVDEITMNVNSLPLEVGDIVAEYGPPCRVMVSYGDNPTEINIFYNGIFFSVIPDSDKISGHPIIGLHSRLFNDFQLRNSNSPEYSCTMVADVRGDDQNGNNWAIFNHWLGFSDLSKYMVLKGSPQ